MQLLSCKYCNISQKNYNINLELGWLTKNR